MREITNEDEQSDKIDEMGNRLASSIFDFYQKRSAELGPKNICISQVGFIQGLSIAIAMFIEMGRRMSKEDKRDSFKPMVLEVLMKYIDDQEERASHILDEFERMGDELLKSMSKH